MAWRRRKMKATRLLSETLLRAQERFEETLDQLDVAGTFDQISNLADLAYCSRIRPSNIRFEK